MPLIAFALEFKEAYDQIQKEVDRVTRRELREKAKAVLAEARRSIEKGAGHSSPGSPFKSKTGATKKLLGMTVSKRTAFVGFRREKAKTDKKTGKKLRPARAVPNILEHGSRKMDPRPVLEPALERVKSHPF